MKTIFTTMLKAARKVRRRTLKVSLALPRIPAPLKIIFKPVRNVSNVATRLTSTSKSLHAELGAEKLPVPGTSVERLFSYRKQKLAYRLYVPVSAQSSDMPLLMMLHGCGQSADNFAAGTRMNTCADERGMLVVYPQQSSSANVGRCWNWHRPVDQKRGSGEPALLAALTRHLIASCKADARRVYIAGLSAGACAAAITAAAYPELYKAVGVHSGLARGDIETLQGALSAMRHGSKATTIQAGSRTVRTIVFHGDEDRIVHPSNAEGFLALAQQASSHPFQRDVEQGHQNSRDFTRSLYKNKAGVVMLENWTIHGGGHMWSGGSASGAYADPAGPDASSEMVRFFLDA